MDSLYQQKTLKDIRIPFEFLSAPEFPNKILWKFSQGMMKICYGRVFSPGLIG